MTEPRSLAERLRIAESQDEILVLAAEVAALESGEPPYPYFYRSAVQRVKTTLHKLTNEVKGNILPNLRLWKQRYKSVKPSLLKRAEAAEGRAEAAEAKIAQVQALSEEKSKWFYERAVSAEALLREAPCVPKGNGIQPYTSIAAGWIRVQYQPWLVKRDAALKLCCDGGNYGDRNLPHTCGHDAALREGK